MNLVDFEGERPQDSDAWGLAFVFVYAMIYISYPLIGDFMIHNCTVDTSTGTVRIRLIGNEDFINRIMYIDPKIFGRDVMSIDTLIIAIPEFKLMAAWVGLIYLMTTNEFFALNPSVIAREIAFHIWGFMYFPHTGKLGKMWAKCKVIDINPNTDRWYENYLFGYKWPKWLEWLI